MKKVLTIFMAILMLVPCITLAVTAQETVVNDTYVNTGWEGLNVDTDLCPGRTVLSKTYTKPFLASWGEGYNKDTHTQITFNHVFGNPYDISEMAYLTMEVYASKSDVFANRFIIELTSSGTRDSQENNYGGSLTNYVTDIGDNWYLIELPISKMTGTAGGGFNKESINYMRMYSDNNTVYEVGEGFTFAIRSLGFSAEGSKFGNYIETNVFDVTETWKGDPGQKTDFVVGKTVYRKDYSGKPFLAGWADETKGHDATFDKTNHVKINIQDDFTAVDISNSKYLMADLYVTNSDLFNKYFLVKIGSDGKTGTCTDYRRMKLTDYVTALGDNWYRLAVPLDMLIEHNSGGACDKAQCNFVQIVYDDPTLYSFTGTFTVGIASLGFSSRTADAEMLGAGIRCADPSGLRFMSSFPKTGIELIGAGTNDANFGLILVSEKVYAQNPNMTFSEAVAAGIQVPAKIVEEKNDSYNVYAVLKDVDATNYKKNVVAIPYANSNIVGTPMIRSIYGVAQCVVNDSTAASAHKTFCAGLIAAAQ